MSFASWILWREVKSQHLWILSAKYDGPTAWMWPDAPKIIPSWISQTQRGNQGKYAIQKGFWIWMQPNSLHLAFHTHTTIAHPTFNSWWQEFHDHIFSELVHSFCLELMPDFQPTSEVTQLFFSSDQTLLLLIVILTIPCRIQYLPLKPGQSFIMQYIQFLLWDLNPQPWLSWWPGMPQWTQFSSVLLLTRGKAYP
jgi:hypothetical protein